MRGVCCVLCDVCGTAAWRWEAQLHVIVEFLCDDDDGGNEDENDDDNR